MKFIRSILTLAFTLLVALNAPQVLAQKSIFDTSALNIFGGKDEFVSVDQAFQLDFQQQQNQLQIRFNVMDGYYLYRHQFKFTAINATITVPELPQGKEHEDEFFGIQQIYDQDIGFTLFINQAGENATLKIRYQGCAKKGLCYPPETKEIALMPVAASSADAAAILSAINTIEQAQVSKPTPSSTTAITSEQNRLADMLKQDSLLLTLLAFFTGGLLLAFTPCVFPMYPILTGIIAGQGNKLTTQKAFSLSFIYVQGMAITYTLLGIIVALAGAQFQAMFQHPVVLIGLSIVFILLALAMFGGFNLALPASWQNKLNNLSNNQKGGSITGVLTMGVISGLVASPCTTAPLTGALLYISQTGDVVLGASALYALSLGMGLPLLILGSSGGKLLPKAGAWMNVVKNFFGFLLLAVPVFLLERLISEQVTMILWATLLIATASYFYTVNQQTKPSFGFGLRSALIFISLFFGVNLLYQQVFPAQNAVHQQQEHGFKQISSLTELTAEVKKANSDGKTVMLDLYADWCIACKEFEKYTFNQQEVQAALANTVLLQMDLTDTDSPTSIELMDHYQIFGLPSILFYDLQGKELTNQRVTGFMEATPFADHIRSIFK